MHGIESGPFHWLMMTILYFPEILAVLGGASVIAIAVVVARRRKPKA